MEFFILNNQETQSALEILMLWSRTPRANRSSSEIDEIGKEQKLILVDNLNRVNEDIICKEHTNP